MPKKYIISFIVVLAFVAKNLFFFVFFFLNKTGKLAAEIEKSLGRQIGQTKKRM